MSGAVGRARAEEVLGVVRKLLRGRAEVFGSGLTRLGDRYAVEVMTIRPVDDLPDEIDGVPILQQIGEPPGPW